MIHAPSRAATFAVAKPIAPPPPVTISALPFSDIFISSAAHRVAASLPPTDRPTPFEHLLDDAPRLDRRSSWIQS